MLASTVLSGVFLSVEMCGGAGTQASGSAYLIVVSLESRDHDFVFFIVLFAEREPCTWSKSANANEDCVNRREKRTSRERRGQFHKVGFERGTARAGATNLLPPVSRLN